MLETVKFGGGTLFFFVAAQISKNVARDQRKPKMLHEKIVPNCLFLFYFVTLFQITFFDVMNSFAWGVWLLILVLLLIEV